MVEKKPLYISPGEKDKRGFEDLECYQLALQVMAKVHAFSKSLPPDEKYDLYAQIRRSSKGVTGNIGTGVIIILTACVITRLREVNSMKHLLI